MITVNYKKTCAGINRMACTYAVAKKGDEHMGKKKAVRSVPAQIVIGSAADLGLMLALTAIHGGAHAWRRDRAGEYPDSGSLRERIGGVPWKSSCGEGVFAAAASDDACSAWAGIYFCCCSGTCCLWVRLRRTDWRSVCRPLARQSWRRCSSAGSRRRGTGDDAGKLANCKRVN